MAVVAWLVTVARLVAVVGVAGLVEVASLVEVVGVAGLVEVVGVAGLVEVVGVAGLVEVVGVAGLVAVVRVAAGGAVVGVLSPAWSTPVPPHAASTSAEAAAQLLLMPLRRSPSARGSEVTRFSGIRREAGVLSVGPVSLGIRTPVRLEGEMMAAERMERAAVLGVAVAEETRRLLRAHMRPAVLGDDGKVVVDVPYPDAAVVTALLDVAAECFGERGASVEEARQAALETLLDLADDRA
ncbi:hypothetical protein AB0K05_10140 [Nonomuraea sp. NPDC049486]